MTNEELIKAFEEKIKELERKNNLRSLEVIDWIKELIKKLEVVEEKPQPKEIKVELPEEEEKKPAKKKISFKKKQIMFIEFQATAKQYEALKYWEDDVTTEI